MSQTKQSAAQTWAGLVEVGRMALGRQPAGNDVHKLDAWMQEILYCDPVLPGMIAKLTSALAGQGWRIVGPREVAATAAAVLENADGGRGWFHFADACAKSYLMRNAGCFVEVVHQFAPEVEPETGDLVGELAPVTAIYNMDSTKARWLRDRAWPLRYEGQAWSRFDFFHLVENPGDTIATRRRGQCALFRCLEYVKLMGLINSWEQGNLDPDFVDAILLLTGAEDTQFGEAMAAREKAIEEKSNAAKRLAVLANLSEEIKAQLIFLRRRPESLEDFEARVRMVYEVYAMNLGRDVTYWFPSQYSGRSYRTRSEIQSEERQAAESNTFHPKMQEALQRYVIPSSVHFEFDNSAVSDRDYLFRLREFVELATMLYRSNQVDTTEKVEVGEVGELGGDVSPASVVGGGGREYLATRDEIRRFLAQADERFESWAGVERDATESNDDMELFRSMPGVQNAVERYRRGWCGDDEVVDVRWGVVGHGRGVSRSRSVATLAELAAQRVWSVPVLPWLGDQGAGVDE